MTAARAPLSDADRSALAELLYPDVETDLAALRARHGAARDLPEGAYVTRFAPSPTGFIHIGSTMAALLCWKLAQQSGGVFILRIEDTDQNREVEDGVNLIITGLGEMGIRASEGPQLGGGEAGDHGPYQQSHRLGIYHAYARDLVARGHAYPCFMTGEQLTELREQQRADEQPIGLWGPHAASRDLPLADVQARIDAGEEWVLRLRSPAQPGDRIVFPDVVRGDLQLQANYTDAVLLKSDGFPTYHFAHPIDDTLMGISLIVRGDEWLGTAPLHVQIFEALGFDFPPIVHIAPVAKLDGESRRKLSKRHDPEAAVSYYHEAGYLPTSVIEYLLNLLDSAFEDWRAANPDAPYTDFVLQVSHLSRASSLFDLVKLQSVSREVVSRLSADELFEAVSAWATEFRPELGVVYMGNPELAKAAMNIGRDATPPRKDIASWSDIPELYAFFFEESYAAKLPAAYDNFPGHLPKEEVLHALAQFQGELAVGEGESSRDWFGRVKAHALGRGYASNTKKFKKRPDEFIGAIGDFMAILRVVLTGSLRSPDMHAIMDILGQDEVKRRLAVAAAHLAD